MPRHCDEFAWHWRRLAEVHAEGRLVFVLGAGINRKYGLPLWDALIYKLLMESGRVPLLRLDKNPETREKEEEQALQFVLGSLTPDPLLQATLARAAYPDEQAWLAAMTKLLRAPADDGDYSTPDEAGRPLRIIADMLVRVIAKDPSRHLSVLTFNYDDFLEQAVTASLEASGQSTDLLKSVADERTFENSWTSSGIFIYHLHGFLLHGPSKPVLTANSYLPVLQGNHWSWRCMDRALSQDQATALLIGLSLTDPSLRLVLTRWEAWKTPVLGVYLAPPLPVPHGSTLTRQRQLLFLARSILDLYDSVMDRLQLVSYHLSSWDELEPILEEIGREPPDANT